MSFVGTKTALLSTWIHFICDGAMPLAFNGDGTAPTGASTIVYVASVVVSVVVAHIGW